MSPTHFQVVPLEEVPAEESTNDVQHGAQNLPVVLVVDDEPLVADTLTIILERAGFIAYTAYNAEMALELASEVAPALLISDVAMPQMNGVELALAVLAMKPCCKVLLFSGHATSVDLVRAYKAGHELPLLTKPLHPSEMLKQVFRALGIPERHSSYKKTTPSPEWLKSFQRFGLPA